MKNTLFVVMMMAGLMLLSHNTYSQRRAPRQDMPRERFERQAPMREAGNFPCVADLTEEQKTKVQALKTVQLEARLQHRNQMAELQARKRTLMTQKNPNMTEVNQVIDNMQSLQTKRLKDNAAHHQQIRNLLTDEQRLQFDTRVGRGPIMRRGNQAPGGRFRQGGRGPCMY